jgi:hypothetical protein
MTKTKVIKPAKPGLKVGVPGLRRYLAEQGEPMPMTTYWRRRLIAGDVVEVKAAPPAPAKPEHK